MIKYRTRWDEITPMEVSEETKSSVMLYKPGGYYRRELKRSSAHNWFDTWDEAKAFLVAEAEKEVRDLKLKLEQSVVRLNKLYDMRQEG